MAKKEINTESIVTSLQIIKTVCEDNVTDCEKCPLYDEVKGECGMTNLSPCNWKINDENDVWRALL
jgi:hypothetical protein